MTVEIPAGVDWEIWRVVSSSKINATLDEVQHRWSLDDLLDAHETLDMIEATEAEAAAKARGRDR